MNSTTLPIEEYTRGHLQFPFLQSYTLELEILQGDVIGNRELEHLPIGPIVRFEVEEYDFHRLINELTMFEQEHGFSSLEMFSRYINGRLDLTENAREWLDLFILWLGTNEVQQFSCP